MTPVTPASTTNAKSYELVYTESVRLLAQQSTVLESLRTRATFLLSTTTLALTFSAGVGLLGQGAKPLPSWILVVMLIVFVLIAGCTFAILWPGHWGFGISANDVIDHYVESVPPYTLAMIHRDLAIYADREYDANERRLDRLFLAFKVGSGLLAVVVIVLLAGLLAR
jgi:hypothetical protein